MRRTLGHTPHLWVIVITILTLGTLLWVEVHASHQPPAGAAATLEPVFSLPGGCYDRDIRLKISIPNFITNRLSWNKKRAIIFTVDGSLPTLTNGSVYARPVLLSVAAPAVTVIRARAVLPGGELGPVASASYFVGVQATLPMMSLIIEPDDLWDPQDGIYVQANSHKRGMMWERPVDVTYVDEDRRSGFHVQAGVRLHGGASRDFGKKSLRLYFRQEYGIDGLEYPLFADGGVQSLERLVLHNGGQDWYTFPHKNYMNWTLVRNQLADRLALQLDGYATHSQPALLFINGDPWGIYYVRERIDDRFLTDYYGVESADFLDSPEHVGEQATLMGDRENWDRLLQFVESHDLTDPANYAHVQSQVDMANFVDYTILQIYAANFDWPHHNVQQFRPRVQGGRWHWMVWDSDHAFGAGQHSYVDLNLVERVLDYDYPETGGRDALLLRRLLENPVFLERFLSRGADLLNTTLASRSVTAHVDALAGELAPDIAYETTRWSSLINWESSVEELRDFARRRLDFVRQHLVERFGLAGTAQLTFNPPTGGSGYVAVNGMLLQDLPWQGVYFQGIPIQITAVPAPGYRFAGWDPPELEQRAAITLTAHAAQTITPRFEMLGDGAHRPGDVVITAYDMNEEDSIYGGWSGDWFELHVTRSGGVDLRGWRLTDNDTKTATDEGSLIFTDDPAFARVPHGTRILVIVDSPPVVPPRLGEEDPQGDDLNTWDRRMVLHVGNGTLDTQVDSGFNLGPNDNLVLLAPGPTQAFEDDRGIAFAGSSDAVTPASFGVLVDGVLAASTAAGSQSDRQTHDQLSIWPLVLLAGSAVLYLNLRQTAKYIH